MGKQTDAQKKELPFAAPSFYGLNDEDVGGPVRNSTERMAVKKE
ncbi:hypothetical protein [Peribacillus frigoritolerans]